ncbi:MAG TPA: hypothetical protein VK669_03050 [Candidatus Limnocylindrales bacterium]|nr:hypothetical protein [Candidatus Limnocylindrales bacterium]
MPPKKRTAKAKKSSLTGRKRAAENTAAPTSVAAESLAPTDIRPLQEVILALVQETSLARIRHRALLDVLRDGFTVERYYARFVELYKRDFQPLACRTLIAPEVFAQRFSEWIDKTDLYYSTFWTDSAEADDAEKRAKTS